MLSPPTSAIRFVTPGQREDIAILAYRHRVYQDAQRAKPTRWAQRTPDWEPIDQVWLNPPKEHAQSPNFAVAQAAWTSRKLCCQTPVAEMLTYDF